MKRSFALIAVCGLFVALHVGCKKDDAPAAPPAAEQAAAQAAQAGQEATAAAAKAQEEAGKAAVAGTTGTAAEVQPQPTPVDSPAAAVPEGAPAAAAGDLPIEDSKLDKLIEYSEAMTKILEDNATDPAAAAKKLEEYLASNKTEREALLTEFEGLKEKLTPDQQTALGMKLLTKLGPLMQRMQKLFMEHPELASDPKIQEAMTPFKR